jgi:MFS family permease
MIGEKSETRPNAMASEARRAPVGVIVGKKSFGSTEDGARRSPVCWRSLGPRHRCGDNRHGARMVRLHATFGVGLAARPLGAILCGHLGDKLGRRNLLLVTVTVMGLSSVLIGLLPTYAQIGATSQFLLVALRIIQGFALGGSWRSNMRRPIGADFTPDCLECARR